MGKPMSWKLFHFTNMFIYSNECMITSTENKTPGSSHCEHTKLPIVKLILSFHRQRCKRTPSWTISLFRDSLFVAFILIITYSCSWNKSYIACELIWKFLCLLLWIRSCNCAGNPWGPSNDFRISLQPTSAFPAPLDQTTHGDVLTAYSRRKTHGDDLTATNSRRRTPVHELTLMNSSPRAHVDELTSINSSPRTPRKTQGCQTHGQQTRGNAYLIYNTIEHRHLRSVLAH